MMNLTADLDGQPPSGPGADRSGHFIPAVHFNALTPLYDPLIRWLMPEAVIKQRLIEQARLAPGFGVLDLGCGTGTLAIRMKLAQPGAVISGLDADRAILDIARRKAVASGVDVTFVEAMAYRLPFRDGAFERVVSSLVMHHLTLPDKRRAACEAYRILRPGGELHVLDFGAPHDPASWALSLAMRWLEEVGDNIRGRLPAIFTEAGFEAVEELEHRMTVFGSVSFYRARKPAEH